MELCYQRDCIKTSTMRRNMAASHYIAVGYPTRAKGLRVPTCAAGFQGTANRLLHSQCEEEDHQANRHKERPCQDGEGLQAAMRGNLEWGESAVSAY